MLFLGENKSVKKRHPILITWEPKFWNLLLVGSFVKKVILNLGIDLEACVKAVKALFVNKSKSSTLLLFL